MDSSLKQLIQCPSFAFLQMFGTKPLAFSFFTLTRWLGGDHIDKDGMMMTHLFERLNVKTNMADLCVLLCKCSYFCANDCLLHSVLKTLLISVFVPFNGSQSGVTRKPLLCHFTATYKQLLSV